VAQTSTGKRSAAGRQASLRGTSTKTSSSHPKRQGRTSRQSESPGGSPVMWTNLPSPIGAAGHTPPPHDQPE